MLEIQCEFRTNECSIEKIYEPGLTFHDLETGEIKLKETFVAE